MHWASQYYAGKSVIVVGGTSGIGLGVATAFRDAGATVFATGATDVEVATASSSAGIAFHRLDVRDTAMVKAGGEASGPLAALINCAGVNLRAAEFELETFETVLDINLTGAMRVATAFR